MANPVDLNFVSRSRPRWPWLALAGTLMMIALGDHNDLQRDLEVARLKQLSQQEAAGRSSGRSQPAFPDLHWPWANLLDALEQARQPDVALLSLEADGHANQLRLSAETPDSTHLQTYLQALNDHGLVTPRLSRQEVVQPEAGPELIRFNVEAAWQH
jgi:hypothetical protein